MNKNSKETSAEILKNLEFKSIFESLPGLLNVLLPDDPKFTIVDVNDGFLAHTGKKRDEILGRGLFEAFPEDSSNPNSAEVSKIRSSLKAVIQTNAPMTIPTFRYDITTQEIDEGFDERYWQVILSPVFSADGELLYIILKSDDRTEFTKSLKKINETQDRSRLIIEGVTDYAIYMLDPQGTVITWNEGAQKLKQYRADEIIGKSFSIFYTDEDLRLGKPEIELKHAKLDGRFEDEGWRIRKDRSRFWANVIVTAIRNKNGALVGFSKITRDLTERKKAEEALKVENELLEKRVRERTEALTESEGQFRTLADAMPHLAWIAHADGFIFWYNSRWYDYTGTRPADMEGWGWQRVHDPQELPAVMERWSASIATGQPFEMEFPLRGVNGEYRWFLTRVIPVRDTHGQITRWFGTNTDIDDKRKISEFQKNANVELEKRVKERTTDLELANKEMESFSYSVSHDLRAPLRSISGFCAHLLHHSLDRLDEEGRDDLARVVAAAQRMGRLIDDLLNLSRVSRTQITNQTIDLAEIAESVNFELQRLEPLREISVQIQHPLSPVSADPGLMRIVLQNLFSNARKYTSKNPQAHIEFGQMQVGQKTVYFIRDNGVGFDMKYANKLFGAFQRLHSDDEFEGTGIGLATVKRIMRRHKGDVWAEAHANSGATFFFCFEPVEIGREGNREFSEHNFIG